MKKFLQAFMTCFVMILFAQNKEVIKFRGNITNNSEGSAYKFLTVLDQRKINLSEHCLLGKIKK
jgi:hypothetical protein